MSFVPNTEQAELMALLKDAFQQYKFSKKFAVDNAYFVVKGAAGRGKSTTVTQVLVELFAIIQTEAFLKGQPVREKLKICLTAPTNKAVNVLSEMEDKLVTTSMPIEFNAMTLHGLLNLAVKKDKASLQTSLKDTDPTNTISDTIIIIDEASMVDSFLMETLLKKTTNCFIIFMLDPYQHKSVNLKGMGTPLPVLSHGWPEYELVKPERFDQDSPIFKTTEAFLEFVKTGVLSSFDIDNDIVQHVDADNFFKLVVNNADLFKKGKAKIICWRNVVCTSYNFQIMEHIFHQKDFLPGDFALCNSFWSGHPIQMPAKELKNVSTDATVQIVDISSAVSLGVEGRNITFKYFNDTFTAFCPYDYAVRKRMISKAFREKDYVTLNTIDSWIDLRPAYAITSYKAQGSTYEKVFIDLNDLSQCKHVDINELAIMLYVASSRASTQLIFTGEL